MRERFSSLFSGIQDWWQAREPRERVLIGVLLPIILIIVLYLYIWQPLAQSVDAAQAKHDRYLQLAPQLIQMSARLSALQQAGFSPTSNTQNPSELLRNLLTQNQLNTPSNQMTLQVNDNEISVQINDAPFDKLLSVLSGVENAGLIIDSFDATRTGAGVVNARVSIQTPTSTSS